MRSGIGFFAVCGVMGLALNVSTAADYPSGYDDSLVNPPAAPRTVQHLSRDDAARDQQPQATGQTRRPKTFGSLEEEYTRPANAEPAARNARQPQTQASNSRGTGRTASSLSSVRNYHEELFGAQTRPAARTQTTAKATQRIVVHDPNVYNATPNGADDQNAGLIHAEYQRSQAKQKSGEIRQVQAVENVDVNNPFRPSSSPQPDFDFGAGAAQHGSTEPGSTGYTPESEAKPHEAEQPAAESRVRFLPGGQPSNRTEAFDTQIQPEPSTPRNTSDAHLDPAPAAQAPSVTVQWIKQGEIRVGQECAFALVVKNNGETVANNVEIDAFFPNTIRLVSAQPQPATATDHLSWAMPALQPGEEQTIQIRLIPSKRGDLETSANVRFTGATASTFQVEEPMLQIEVKGPEEVMAGDLASQTVIVSNPGTGLATNIVIEAHVPEGLEHPRGERLMMEIGALAPGETRMVRLPLAAVKGGKQSVSIEARADAELSHSITRDINVIAPSIQVAVEGPALRYIGRAADYLVTVTNDGSGATNNVRVMHQLPQGFKFVRADKGGTFDASQGMVSWFVGRLEAGESAALKVALAPTQPGNFAHHVSATTEQGARAAADFQTQVEGTASLVLEIVDLDDPVEVGAETAYEVRVRNEGTATAGNVGVSCELPTVIDLVGAKGPSEHIVESGVIVFKALDHLDAGKTAVYRINVISKVPGNHRFRARLVSDSNVEPLIFEELTKFYGDPIPGSERTPVPPTALRR